MYIPVFQCGYLDLTVCDWSYTESSDPYLEKPALVCIVPGGRCVAGLAVLDGQLYVVRTQSSELELYDVSEPAGSVQLLNHVCVVHGLRQPTDIAASQTSSVVFITDAVGVVLVVDQTGTVHSTLHVRIRVTLAAADHSLYVALYDSW